MIKSQITFKQLEAFVFVVDTGTFRAAAIALGTTQPNISTRIASLEKTLNTKLLTRGSGSIHLTSKGEALLIKARQVLWAGESLIEEADQKELIQERLRLGVTELVACTWLRDYLRRLKSAYPNLRVELAVDLSTVIDHRLSEGQLDLALHSEPFKTNSLASTPLGVEQYCWVAHSDIAHRLPENPNISDLFEHIILTHAKHTQAGIALHELADERNLNAGQIVHSSALSACVPMALEGLGIGMLQETLVQESIITGELCKINSEWLPNPLSFVARYHENRAPLFISKAAKIAADAMAFNTASYK
jgi:DNA-binding transcriptional LysR family regulator